MKIQTQIDMNSFLERIVNRAKNEHETMGEIFEVCLKTGLRIAEVIDLNCWIKGESFTWNVKTKKGSQVRQIKSLNLPEMYLKELVVNTGRYSLINYESCKYFFEKMMEGRRFNVGNKGVYLHLFRYNFIRNMKEKGVEFTKIVAEMGHKEKESTVGYLLNDIKEL